MSMVDVLHKPLGVVSTFIGVFCVVSLFVVGALGYEPEPSRPSFLLPPTKVFGCDWFPVVPLGDFMGRVENKKTNRAHLTWDTNGDNHWNVQHDYIIDTWGENGWAAIYNQYPSKMLFDFDGDRYVDVIVEREVGASGRVCSDWRSVPIPHGLQKPQQNQPDVQGDCTQRDCDHNKNGRL